MNITRLRQIGFTLSLISLIPSLLYLFIGEIALILERILTGTIIIVIFTFILEYIVSGFSISKLLVSIKLKKGAMLGFATGIVAMAIIRSGAIKAICQLLHVACRQLQTSGRNDFLMLPTLPLFLAVLALVTGLAGLILIALARLEDFAFED
ncbi:hypothetical protein H6G17_08590 [Chroococcidiopsis sp. FACHB-1243]|nr:hypothetical protein [Chroococcidiopsis sp. [FACHB-1243]]